MPPSSIAYTWAKILTHLTAQTETLDIQCYPAPHLSPNTVHLPIPTTLKFFLKRAPLKKLALEGCITDFKSPLFSNLSVLCIGFTGNTSSISVWAWLEVLTAMPKLVYLDFQNAICIDKQNDSIEHPQPLRMIQLSFLRPFRIMDHATTGSILFLHTALPLSCLLEVDLYGKRLNAGPCDAIIARYCLKVVHDLANGGVTSLLMLTLRDLGVRIESVHVKGES